MVSSNSFFFVLFPPFSSINYMYLLLLNMNSYTCGCKPLYHLYLKLYINPSIHCDLFHPTSIPNFYPLIIHRKYCGYYSIYRKLRIKPPVQLFINVCIALVLLYIIYIGALYSRTNDTACTVLSTLLHYTFTVSFLAILVQALYMFLQGVCVPMKRYPLIVIILCWGKYTVRFYYVAIINCVFIISLSRSVLFFLFNFS